MSAEPHTVSVQTGEDPAERAHQVRPFDVDAAAMEMIRPMQFRDAQRVAELHQAAMGNSLWARLGVPFLVQLYCALINDPRFLGFVYDEPLLEAGVPGDRFRVRGFIAGSQDTETMFRETFKRAWFLLGPVAARGILADPAALRQLIRTARYFDASAPALPRPVAAESLFCSFERDLRGKRISGHINKVLFDDLAARGHQQVKITTELANVGANRQLRSWGFADVGRFRFYGKDMVVYVLDLSASPRVDPISRHPAI